ncbi:MAG: hypothetical protein K8F91_10140, partial [Candidatus Obscuribacterales bacterium]|nr:hypothetical protein [Candidatus Obscuribacterales bacterium]
MAQAPPEQPVARLSDQATTSSDAANAGAKSALAADTVEELGGPGSYKDAFESAEKKVESADSDIADQACENCRQEVGDAVMNGEVKPGELALEGEALSLPEARVVDAFGRVVDGQGRPLPPGADGARERPADNSREGEIVPEVARPGDKPASAAEGERQLQDSLKRMQEGGWIGDQNNDGKFESGNKFSDATAKQNFGKQLNDFLGREDLSAAEKASVLNSTTELLEMKDSPMSQGLREQTATTQMENFAHWDSNDQGKSNRCNVYQVASAEYYLSPQSAAERTNNIAKDGKWDIPSDKSSTGSPQSVDMSDAISNLEKSYQSGTLGGIDGGKGQSNSHGTLDSIALSKMYNQQRGLIYSVGQPTFDNPTGESLHRMAQNEDGTRQQNPEGSYVKGDLFSKGSPGMTAADVADLAESKELGIGAGVTVVAGDTWNNGRTTDNLEVVKEGAAGQQDMQAITDRIQKTDKHYMIMHVSGHDKAIVDAAGQRHASGGGHAGHSIGAAWNAKHNINDRVDETRTGGEWKGNNTWGTGNDNIWDQNLVGGDGRIKLATAVDSMDMNEA